MMQITEDTPPDMLAGAMDLTVHLPNGRTMKMSVERSTPMMDLLVQITVANHLQLSNHTLQALGMGPSSEYNDVALPFKPNTPIGALDTQHVRVLPKGRTLPAVKYIIPGHQPFESTFRLKIHLPRNQLYVTRVSRNVLLEDIMKKVCEEKNLDPTKYELKHPGNLVDVLDPKLTLSDYQITEIYVVLRGTTNLNQEFSAADIMSLRKEEERKQMHNKTGGGVFNLIFKRGKSSMGSGSVSSDNRSISPTHSDDSRSVTPPALQSPSIIPPPKKDPPPERPKPPQRKRRPAPKPPQVQVTEALNETETENTTSATSKDGSQEPPSKKTSENGLTICHSRNSSDSSGYHEASILSDHCANASLPRSRPKSAFVAGEVSLQGTSNLTKMAVHSRSTASLVTGRRKKAAPPPPPLAISPASSVVAHSEKPSPLVASHHSDITIKTDPSEVLENSLIPPTNLIPIPKPRSKISDATLRKKPHTQLPPSRGNTLRTTNYKEFVQKDEDAGNLRENNKQIPEYNKDDSFKLNVPLDNAHLDGVPDKFPVEEMLASLEAVNRFASYGELTESSQRFQEVSRTSRQAPENSKRPEVVAVIPKTPKENKKYTSNTDSFGKKRCFQIGSSILEQNFDPETSSLRSVGSVSSKNSVASALNFLDDEIADLDEKMFVGSLCKRSGKKRPEVFNQLFGIHNYDSDLEKKSFTRESSVGSLTSSCSIPGFSGARMRKWSNSEELNSVSLSSAGVKNRWLIGDSSDTESVESSNLTSGQTPFDNLPPLESSTPIKSPSEEKSLDSTDSGIAQDTQLETEKEIEGDFDRVTPIPPPILDQLQSEIDSTINVELTNEIIPPPPLVESTLIKDDVQAKKEPKLLNNFSKISIPKEELPALPGTQPPVLSEINKLDRIFLTSKQTQGEVELVDIDWQYQLPSPPKAFRDASPTQFVNNETNSISDFKDSVVTSPELFEKLKSLEDNQLEQDTLKSEVTSIASEEPLNTLSLEHLEKRKSLVYNRELSTSLKMTDNLDVKASNSDNFTSSLASFNATYDELHKNTVQHKQPPKPLRTNVNNTLPNFKITTYDVPKQNIKVFEDDTIRSNTLVRSEFGRSMENISFSKKSENSTHEEKEYKFYKPKPSNLGSLSSVSRSGSFSTDTRFPIKPVSRSKSTLTLNKYHTSSKPQETMSRSNSLFDVSGLQSLEVMKLIQNKLNTPTGSMENINSREKPFASQKPVYKVDYSEADNSTLIETTPVNFKPQPPSPQPVKKHYYRGPPAVNMTTWSERPKVPVAVKEDEDYKLGNATVSSKLIVNTMNKNITCNNSVEIKSRGVDVQVNEKEVIVNGTQHITQKSGNIVIKIGGMKENGYSIENQQFRAPLYRKPLNNINKNGSSLYLNQRPHSVAFGSEIDTSRVPVVRSVELKKPYKDSHANNTSITHIYQGNDHFNSTYQLDKTDSFVEKFRSTENLRNIEKQDSESAKRVFRVNSFKPPDNQAQLPVVRGFRNVEPNHRLSWNCPSSYGTLPSKTKMEKDYTTNQNVPFSQMNLRRTESNKNSNRNPNDIHSTLKASKNQADSNFYNSMKDKRNSASVPPPPPPQMHQRVAPVEIKSQSSSADARGMLLESIRNFGGKKGLRAIKA